MRRNLADIPVLDRNWTTVLDLSHNLLKEIHGAPFRSLSNLTDLDLSCNMISTLDSIRFKGLYSLVKLNLYANTLSVLSSDVFNELHKLVYLDIDANPVYDIPSQTLTTLNSLQYLYMTFVGSTFDTVMSEFHSLISLSVLKIWFNVNVTNTTFHPLAGLPIQTFHCIWTLWCEDCSFYKTALAPFTSLRELFTNFKALPALESLHSPLQTLTLVSFSKVPVILHNTTFQDLWNVREFLINLALTLPALRQIENDAFMWTPNVINLILYKTALETLAKYSFRGLNVLEKLDLSNNKLTAVPYGALIVIGKFAPLMYLDLSSNSISSSIPENAFAGLTSLSYLNLENNYSFSITRYIYTPWLNLLQNLNHLIIGFGGLVGGVTIDLPFHLLSLQILEIRNTDLISLESNICLTFPNLRFFVTSNIEITKIGKLHHLALHECSFLTKLDLSGSTLGSINATDLKNTNISIPSLQDLTLAKSKLTSIGQVLFIKAPNLAYLNVSDNQIITIDSTIKGVTLVYL